jgi:hypothetical protein
MAIPEKPTLTTPPAAPIRGQDPTVFADRANAYLQFITSNVSDLTEAIDWQNTVFTAVDQAMTRSESAAIIAAGSANYQGQWSDASGPATAGGSYENLSTLWLLLSDVSNIAANEPVEGSLWTELSIYTANVIDNLLDDKANQATTYTKTEADNLLDDKANQSTTYTKTEADNLLNAKANQATTYTKTEADNLLDDKANQSTTYTKTEADNLLNAKANQATTYTKTESVAQFNQFGVGAAGTALTNAESAVLGSNNSIRFESNAAAVAANYPNLGAGTGPVHWNLMTYGESGRITQLATEVFGQYTGGKGFTFIRVKHDTWQPWVKNFTEVGGAFIGSISATNLSGTNTGDQTNISGNAGTVSNITTAQVGSATAGLALEAVGSYVMAKNFGGGKQPGSTVSGSSLAYAAADGGSTGTLSGTWRLMGTAAFGDVSTFLRIS